MIKPSIRGRAEYANVQDTDRRTPLHYADANVHVDVVKRLIDQDTEINAAESKNKRTPLHYAVANGLLELLQYLLGIG